MRKMTKDDLKDPKTGHFIKKGYADAVCHKFTESDLSEIVSPDFICGYVMALASLATDAEIPILDNILQAYSIMQSGKLDIVLDSLADDES